MFWIILWSAVAAGIFIWNETQTSFIGIMFTKEIIGFPINGGWLFVAVAVYCSVRTIVRKRRDRKTTGD